MFDTVSFIHFLVCWTAGDPADWQRLQNSTPFSMHGQQPTYQANQTANILNKSKLFYVLPDRYHQHAVSSSTVSMWHLNAHTVPWIQMISLLGTDIGGISVQGGHLLQISESNRTCSVLASWYNQYYLLKTEDFHGILPCSLTGTRQNAATSKMTNFIPLPLQHKISQK